LIVTAISGKNAETALAGPPSRAGGRRVWPGGQPPSGRPGGM